MDFAPTTSAAEYLAPVGYTGLYGFHKYWGKKPPETVSFLVEHLSNSGDLVLDPFLGSGAIARESFLRNRRFVGCDINPVAIELSQLVMRPPPVSAVATALRKIQERVCPEIEQHYRLEDGSIASHFLWEGAEMKSVWGKPKVGRTRIEFLPTNHDRKLFASYQDYRPVTLRPLRIYQNSRINARAAMDWSCLFTGRAIRSIDLLRQTIFEIGDPDVQRAMRLVLTAAVGQMSKMVFAIENRGKAHGAASSRIEVGSWVIGFWTPELRFEVNAWNCFANKAAKLLRGLREERAALQAGVTNDPLRVASRCADVALVCSEAQKTAETLPAQSVDLILTDPPHGDRIPYLELSEIWNAILGREPRLEDELVISNARERGKDITVYAAQLRAIFGALASALKKDGIVAVLFNSRSNEEWSTLLGALEYSGLIYRGRVPMVYSAKSVIQDNRDGALEHDYVVLFSRDTSGTTPGKIQQLAAVLPQWSPARPA